MIISTLLMSSQVMLAAGFLSPLSSTFHPLSTTQLKDVPKKSFKTSIRMADFFDEEFDEDEDEDDPFSVSPKPSPPSYPDPFANSKSDDNPFTTTNTGGGKTLKPDDEEDIDIMQIATTPMDDFIPKLNIVTLQGRLGQDPNPRYFDDGKVVLNLSLACKRKYHPLERQVRGISSGEEETDWFGLELWGRDAEYATKFVSKGMRVGVTGSLVIDS